MSYRPISEAALTLSCDPQQHELSEDRLPIELSHEPIQVRPRQPYVWATDAPSYDWRPSTSLCGAMLVRRQLAHRARTQADLSRASDPHRPT